MNRRKKAKVIVLVAAFVIIFVPFPTVISNEVVIRFVGAPDVQVPKLNVNQSWECYGSLSGKGGDDRMTDASGMVRFPHRFGYGSVASRIFGRLFATIAVHASDGAQMEIEFTFDGYRRPTFPSHSFTRLEPFATSGTYLDSIGRYYYPFPQGDDGKRRVKIIGDFLHEADRIVIHVE